MPHRSALAILLTLLLLAAASCPIRAEDWQPINPDELKMTGEPMAPGAPAIYLYRQINRDDVEHEQRVYERIKILSEAGRARANVELPYLKNKQAIAFIKARIIRPDGTISNFDGQIEDKAIVSAAGEQLMAKTFTIPLAEVGCIIELRYTLRLDYRYIYDSHWVLNTDLFTRYAKFSLKPAAGFSVTGTWPRGLPPGTKPPALNNGLMEVEVRNVPAFVVEDYIPPEDEIKYHVDFIYSDYDFDAKDVTDYWKHYGKQLYRNAEHFMDEKRAMTRAVAQIIAPSDDFETKLRKIYARVQQLRNLSSESPATLQEQAKLKSNDDVEDLWDHGYGTANQLTLLYAALLRAAGIDATVVIVSARDRYFFTKSTMNAGQLNANVVLVQYQGRDLYLDPGVPFTQFGLLPWFETSVEGLKLDKDGGTWVKTPIPTAFASRIERHANLQLLPEGSLSGKLEVTYTGLEASLRRDSEHLDDAAARAKFLEDEVHSSVAVGVNVTLTNQPAWDSAELPLTAEFNVTIPGWAQSAGHRLLLTLGVFDRDDRHTFEHAEREHPLYFRFLNQRVDTLDIELPAGYSVSSLPADHDSNLSTMAYHMGVAQEGSTVQIRRGLIENAIILPASSYPGVRQFFQSVRAADEQQLVLAYDAAQAQR